VNAVGTDAHAHRRLLAQHCSDSCLEFVYEAKVNDANRDAGFNPARKARLGEQFRVVQSLRSGDRSNLLFVDSSFNERTEDVALRRRL
jgi:hypothetical protein